MSEPSSEAEPKWTCPVCGFTGLTEPPTDQTGGPTYSICPCCGTQYGADDLDKSHADLRKEWVQSGAQWWSQNEPAPEGWSANAQLQAAGHGDGGSKN
jgi:hypothetical protein